MIWTMGDQFLEPNNARAGDEAPEGGASPEEHLPVYAGKWTQEEEQYAQLLMEEFRAGNIPNLENGASMRNYLAKMLICRPKRVTKKYERSGYNGKLTYQSNLVTMSPQEAKTRRQQLAVLRAQFIESRKQRLCLALPTSVRPPQASLTVAASANLNADADTNTRLRAFELGGALLGGSSMSRESTGVDTLLGRATRHGVIGQPYLHGATAAWRQDPMMDHYLSNIMGATPVGPTSVLGRSQPSLTVTGLEALSDQRFLSSHFMATLQAPQQRNPLLNSSSFLQRQGMASGVNPILSGNDTLRQQHVLTQLQIENEQKTNELLTRQQLLADIQMENERKVALERALVEQYQRQRAVVQAAAGATARGTLDESEPEGRDPRQAVLKRTGEQDPSDYGLSQWKKPRGGL
jgi:hypothetical protein